MRPECLCYVVIVIVHTCNYGYVYMRTGYLSMLLNFTLVKILSYKQHYWYVRLSFLKYNYQMAQITECMIACYLGLYEEHINGPTRTCSYFKNTLWNLCDLSHLEIIIINCLNHVVKCNCWCKQELDKIRSYNNHFHYVWL